MNLINFSKHSQSLLPSGPIFAGSTTGTRGWVRTAGGHEEHGGRDDVRWRDETCGRSTSSDIPSFHLTTACRFCISAGPLHLRSHVPARRRAYFLLFPSIFHEYTTRIHRIARSSTVTRGSRAPLAVAEYVRAACASRDPRAPTGLAERRRAFKRPS